VRILKSIVMKKMMLFLVLICSAIFVDGQIKGGGERICGNQFGSFEGMSYAEAIEKAGTIHNEYQDFVLSGLLSKGLNMADTSEFKTVAEGLSVQFFQNHNLDFNKELHSFGLARPADLNFDTYGNGVSAEASVLLEKLKKAVTGFSELNADIFFQQVTEIRKAALQLASDKDVFLVGVPASVAFHSYSYWMQEGQKWLDAFTEKDITSQIKGPNPVDAEDYFKKCKVNLYHLGGADVAGGVQGAIGGAALGPGGALAGGVLTSSVSSLGNLTNQVINCFVSWWPF
jgi:hypothetical protein